jgi:hypothetical protein
VGNYYTFFKYGVTCWRQLEHLDKSIFHEV